MWYQNDYIPIVPTDFTKFPVELSVFFQVALIRLTKLFYHVSVLFLLSITFI